MSDDPNELAKDLGAARVLDFIKAGLWRKARDAAKELCKKDRSRYLALLIQANVGLMREMLGKGLVKEAENGGGLSGYFRSRGYDDDAAGGKWPRRRVSARWRPWRIPAGLDGGWRLSGRTRF